MIFNHARERDGRGRALARAEAGLEAALGRVDLLLRDHARQTGAAEFERLAEEIAAARGLLAAAEPDSARGAALRELVARFVGEAVAEVAAHARANRGEGAAAA